MLLWVDCLPAAVISNPIQGLAGQPEANDGRLMKMPGSRTLCSVGMDVATAPAIGQVESAPTLLKQRSFKECSDARPI